MALGNALRGGPCRVLSSDQRIAARFGKQFVYWNGVELEIDALFSGMFELDGE